MAVRETIQIGHPALKAANKPIKDFAARELQSLVEDLRETMNEEGLIGIAAPQIGENFQVFVTQPRKTKDRKENEDEFRVYINPTISTISREESVIYEGCGSVLHGQLFGPVRRPKEIVIEADGIEGKRFRMRCDGILARVIQHEYDHLQGVEFLEKVSDFSEMMTVEYYREQIKDSPEQVIASRISVLEIEYPD
jgi:peptide deformylase